MSMTPEHIRLVKESFQQVLPVADRVAGRFYAQLFAFDPSIEPLFTHDMDAQGQKLMASLQRIVKGLDDLPAVLPAVEQLAIRHLDYGVQPHHYTTVGNALLVALKQELGDAFTHETRAAWVAAYTLLSRAMKKAAYGDPLADRHTRPAQHEQSVAG